MFSRLREEKIIFKTYFIQKLFLILGFILGSFGSTTLAADIPGTAEIIQQIYRSAGGLPGAIRFKIIGQGAVVEARLGDQGQAKTKLQKEKTLILQAIEEAQIDPVDGFPPLLYLTWKQGHFDTTQERQSQINSWLNRVSQDPNLTIKILEKFLRRYDYLMSPAERVAISPILHAFTLLISQMPFEVLSSSGPIALELLTQAYSSLEDRTGIVKCIQILEERLKLQEQKSPESGFYSHFALAKAWATLGESKEVGVFLQRLRQREKQLSPKDELASLGYLWDKARLASQFIQAGQRTIGSDLLKEILLQLQSYYPFPPNQRREDLAASLLPLAFSIAEIHGGLGREDQLLDILTMIQDLGIPKKDLPMEPWILLVKYQLQQRDYQKARQTAQKIPGQSRERIAMLQIRFGDFSGAMESYKAYQNDWNSDLSLQRHLKRNNITTRPALSQEMVRMISLAMATSKSVLESYHWAKNQPTEDLKAFALLGTLEGISEANRLLHPE